MFAQDRAECGTGSSIVEQNFHFVKSQNRDEQGVHKVVRFVNAPSRGPSPNPFLRLLRKLEGEKRDFWGIGGRAAATDTPNPEKREATL